MIWKPCALKAKTPGGTDSLGNPTDPEWTTVKETSARFTPWTDEQIALEGREVTKNEQRFILPVQFSSLPEFQRAVIDDIAYDITQVIDLAPRWTVIQGKVHKQ